MFMAGYKFMVLNNAFNSHAGFQTREARPKWRLAEARANFKLFENFKKDMKLKYGKPESFELY